MKIPLVQSVTTLPRYQLTYNVSEAEINTKDKKRIIIDNYAVWRITNPKDMITNAGTQISAESRMEEFIYSVVRTELGQLNYDEIINDENTSRGSLNDRVTARVNQLLKADKYGIEVVDVRMKRTDLPPENEQSVYTRMISERQSIAQKYLSEGDAGKRTIEASTDRLVQEMVASLKKKHRLLRLKENQRLQKSITNHFQKTQSFTLFIEHSKLIRKQLVKIR
jgi:modulator of FtsH protease HflC